MWLQYCMQCIYGEAASLDLDLDAGGAPKAAQHGPRVIRPAKQGSAVAPPLPIQGNARAVGCRLWAWRRRGRARRTQSGLKCLQAGCVYCLLR